MDQNPSCAKRREVFAESALKVIDIGLKVAKIGEFKTASRW
jgi:hypothetical protein